MLVTATVSLHTVDGDMLDCPQSTNAMLALQAMTTQHQAQLKQPTAADVSSHITYTPA
jgi:hypothetical protein